MIIHADYQLDTGVLKVIKCADGFTFADPRPLGWSRVGCNKMARLRVYQKNGGNMLGRFASLLYSLYPCEKDSCNKESYLGFVKNIEMN